MSTQYNGSVIKAFRILDLFDGARTEIDTATVARELAISGVTAHRFLKTLEAVGALVSPARGVYRLGFRLVDLAERVMHHQDLADALQPVLDRLTAELQESSFAAVMESDAVVCIARAVSRHTLSVDIRVGVRFESHATAHGKVWLASLSPEQLRAHLDAITLTRLTPLTITDRDALLAEIERVRELGYAVNDGEREAGIRAISVPLRTRDGRMLASLSVFGPQARVDDAVMERALARLRDGVREVQQRLYGAAAAAGG